MLPCSSGLVSQPIFHDDYSPNPDLNTAALHQPRYEKLFSEPRLRWLQSVKLLRLASATCPACSTLGVRGVFGVRDVGVKAEVLDFGDGDSD